MLRCFTISFLCAVLFSSALGAPNDLRIGPIFHEGLPNIEIVVDTNPETSATQLTLLEDGKMTTRSHNVRPFKDTGRGMTVVLALDVSGTMSGQPIREMKRALSALVGEVRPVDRIAVVTFAGDFKVDSPFNATPAARRAAINSLTVRGGITELYLGLRKALLLFEAPDLPERKRLIVVSDGKDEGRAYKLDDVIQYAESRNIPVDTVGLTRIDPSHLSNLERLADLTGGQYALASRSEQLQHIFTEGIKRLQNTPVASFTATSLQDDGSEHRVGVRLETKGRFVKAETRITLSNQSPPPIPGPADNAQRRQWTKLWPWALAVVLLVGVYLLLVALRARKRSNLIRDHQAARSRQLSDDRPLESSSPHAGPEAAHEAIPTAYEYEGLYQSGGDEIVNTGAFDTADQKPRRRRTQIRTEFTSPEPGRPAAVLLAQEGAVCGASLPIETSPFWIGAEQQNTLCIAEDEFVSGYHACIEFRDGTLLLYDNHSTNGTLLNGERLVETPRPLGLGDRITIGHSLFVLARAF